MTKRKDLDPRIKVMARAIALVNYPGLDPAELDRPAKRWDGAKMINAQCAIWEDHIPEAEAGLAALIEGGYL